MGDLEMTYPGHFFFESPIAGPSRHQDSGATVNSCIVDGDEMEEEDVLGGRPQRIRAKKLTRKL